MPLPEKNLLAAQAPPGLDADATANNFATT